MATKAMKVGYHLVRNATATADKAPYLGVAVPIGSLAYDNILRRMLDRGTFMTRATAQYFLNAFYEFAAETIADDVLRINMGAVSLFPMIGGSFDSEDDAYREPRNALYVGATLSQEIRDAVSGMVPESIGENQTTSVRISSVMDIASEEYRLIDGTKQFRIAGINLTVPDGDDESLTLVAADGVTKVADITVISTEDGQRIICELTSAVPKGTYHVRLVSHGLDPTAPLATILYRVTAKAGDEPTPTPIAETSDGKCKVMSFTDGASATEFTLGHPWKIGGVGLYGENAPEGEWALSQATAEVDGTTVEFTVTFNGDGTEATFGSHMFDPSAGTYENVTLRYPVTRGGETETLELPLPLLVVE